MRGALFSLSYLSVSLILLSYISLFFSTSLLITPSLGSSLCTGTSFFFTEEFSLCSREYDHCHCQAYFIIGHCPWRMNLSPVVLISNPPECLHWPFLGHMPSPLTSHCEWGRELMRPWLHAHPFSQAQATVIGNLTRITWSEMGRRSLPKKGTWKRGAGQIKEVY